MRTELQRLYERLVQALDLELHSGGSFLLLTPGSRPAGESLAARVVEWLGEERVVVCDIATEVDADRALATLRALTGPRILWLRLSDVHFEGSAALLRGLNLMRDHLMWSPSLTVVLEGGPQLRRDVGSIAPDLASVATSLGLEEHIVARSPPVPSGIEVVPEALARDHVPWTRTWRRVDHTVPAGRPRQLGQIVDRCAVLLGPAGAGKTRELEWLEHQLAREEQPVVTLDLRGGDIAVALDRAKQSVEAGSKKVFVLLDHLDEGVSRARVDVQLRDGMARMDATQRERVHLRITCRSASWDRFRAVKETLGRAFSPEEMGVWELEPLDEAAVRRACRQLEPDMDPETVLTPRLAALTAWPLTLRMLLERDDLETQCPSSTEEVWSHHLYELVRRGHEDARVATDPESLLAVAGRLALVGLLSGRARVVDACAPSRPGELAVQEALGADPTEPLHGKRVVDVDRERILDALASELFVSGGRWAHTGFAEFLAARQLSRRHLEAERHYRVLSVPAGHRRRLAGPLLGVAAWLATFERPFFDLVSERDPWPLLSADGAAFDPEQRRRLLSALLKQWRAAELAPSRPARELAKLDFDGIASELGPVLADRSEPVLLRTAAIDIVAACRVSALDDALASIVRTSDEELRLRVRAARALEGRGRSDLAAVLTGDAALTGDEDDDLRGALLAASWPHAMQATDLFACFTEEKRGSRLGDYGWFLHGLPRRIDQLEPASRREHLAVGMAWARDHLAQHGHGGRYRRTTSLATELLGVAWKLRDDPVLADPYAAALSVAIHVGHAPGVWKSLSRHAAADRPLRRELLLRLVRSAVARGDGIGAAYDLQPLVAGDDLEWLDAESEAASAEPELQEALRWTGQYARVGYGPTPPSGESTPPPPVFVPDDEDEAEEPFHPAPPESPGSLIARASAGDMRAAIDFLRRPREHALVEQLFEALEQVLSAATAGSDRAQRARELRRDLVVGLRHSSDLRWLGLEHLERLFEWAFQTAPGEDPANRLLDLVAQQGTWEAAQLLTRLERRHGQSWPYPIQDAREHARASDWHPLSPEDALAAVGCEPRWLVESDAELLERVTAALDQVQHRLLTGEPPLAPQLWNHPHRRGPPPEPRHEEELSDWLLIELRRSLEGSGILLQREVQVTRGSVEGKGQRLDIKAVAAPREHRMGCRGPVELRCVIEIKKSGNREVMSALQAQLVGRYLETSGAGAGCYVVFWFPGHTAAGARQLQALEESLRDEAERLSTSSRRVVVRVLDATLPGGVQSAVTA